MSDVGAGTRPVPIACGHRTSYGVHEGAMRVRVKLFASLCRYARDAVSGIPFECQVPEGATLSDLVDCLKLPREEVNPVRRDGRLAATLSDIILSIIIMLAMNGGPF
jgi:hypothetical protein